MGMSDDTQSIIYQEILPPSRWTAFLFFGAMVGIIFLITETGSPLALIPFIVFILTAPNINALRITIADSGVTLTIRPPMKQNIPWDDIAGCTIDTVSTLRYFGFGTSVRRVHGVWRAVYIVPGVRRVVLTLRKGTIKEYVLSTEQPERVVDIIHAKLREQAKRNKV